MSEEHAASNRSSNERIYLGIIAVLVVVVIYQFINRPVVKPKLPAPPPPVVKMTKPPEPESTHVVESWNQIPMADISKQWLAENNVKLIILLDNKLQARVADKDGKELKVCARPVDGGTGLAGECAKIKAATVTRATDISVEIRESSPGWCWVNIGGNRIYGPFC